MGWKNETYIYFFVGYTNLSVFNMGYKTLITTIFQLDDLANETSVLGFLGKSPWKTFWSLTGTEF